MMDEPAAPKLPPATPAEKGGDEDGPGTEYIKFLDILEIMIIKRYNGNLGDFFPRPAPKDSRRGVGEGG